jgi:hypothetical protein
MPGDPALGLTQMTTQRGHRQPPTDGRSSCASSSPGRPPGRPGPLLTTFQDDDQLQVDPPPAQHGLRQLRAPGSNVGQTTRRRGHGGRPRRPRPSHPCGCRPHRHAPRPHSRPTQRTPERTDIGHRRPDTGHLDAQMPAPDTGHLDRHSPDSGRSHRTLDIGCRTRTRTRDHRTAGIRTSLAATPSDHTLRRPTVFALSYYQPAARPLRRPSRASAHCSPRKSLGSRVARDGDWHPLWRLRLSVDDRQVERRYRWTWDWGAT